MKSNTDDGLTWSAYMLALTPQERRKLRDKSVDAVKYYKAKWKKDKNGQYVVESFNKHALQFRDYLKKQKDLEFKGFGPIIRYIKEDGKKDDLNGHFNHPWGIPSIIFSLKNLPGALVTSPVLRVNDSIINEIDENKDHYVELVGFTG